MKNKACITKRILSLLIAMVMLLGVVTVYAEETGTTTKTYGTLFSQNFNAGRGTSIQNNTHYDIYGNMRANRAVGTTSNIAEVNYRDVPGLGDYSLALYDKNQNFVWKQWDERTYVYGYDDDINYISFTNEGANTYVITEFDMYVNSDVARTVIFDMMDGDTNPTSTTPSMQEHSRTILFGLKFDPTNHKLSYRSMKNGQNAYTEIGDFPLNTWQRYRIVNKVTDETASLGKLDVYADGIIVAEDIEYVKQGNNFDIAYDMLRIGTAGVGTEGGSSTNDVNCIFDNINVYKYSGSDTSTDPVVAPANTGRLISVLRKNMNKSFNYIYASICEPSVDVLRKMLEENSVLYSSYENTNITKRDGEQQPLVDRETVELTEAFEGIYVAYKDGGEQLFLEGEDLLGTGEESDSTYKINVAQYFGGPSAVGGNPPLYGGKYIIDKNIDATAIDGILISTDETSDNYYKYEGPGAALVFDFDFMSKDLIANGTEVSVGFGTRNINATSSTGIFTKGFGIYFDSTKEQMVFTNSDSTFSFEDGEWYRIRYVINVTDENNNFAGTYDVWVNGTKVVSDARINTTDTNVIDCMLLKDFTSDRASNDSFVCYDNLRVYKSNVTNEMPVNDGALLYAIRKAEKKYPVELAGEIENAKTAFEASDRTQESLDNACIVLNDALAGIIQ